MLITGGIVIPGAVPREAVSALPINGGTNACRMDGTSTTFEQLSSGSAIVVARRKVVVLVDGWFEGVRWANVGGAGTLGEAAGFQNVTASATYSVAGLGFTSFAESSQEVLVAPGASTLLRPKGGRFRVFKGETVWVHLMLAGATSADAIYTTHYADRSDGEDMASFTLANIAQARAKRDTAAWTPVNSATIDPPFGKVSLPGPTEFVVTPFKPTAYVAVVGTSRADPGNPNPYAIGTKLESDGAYSRVLNALGVPSIHLAKGSSRATEDLARDKFVFRERLLGHATHIAYLHGQNDFANGVTLTQMQQQALRDTSKWRAEGKIVIGATIHPWVGNAPADFFLTAAGQVPTGGAYEGARQAWNLWVLGKLVGDALTVAGGDASIRWNDVFDDVVDEASLVESAATPGRFKDATIVNAGVATGGSATTLDDAGANWAPHTLNGRMVKWTIAGTTYYGSVISNTATRLYITVTASVRQTINGTYYDAGVAPATPPAAGAAYTLYAPMTVDGNHLCEIGKALVASAWRAKWLQLGVAYVA